MRTRGIGLRNNERLDEKQQESEELQMVEYMVLGALVAVSGAAVILMRNLLIRGRGAALLTGYRALPESERDGEYSEVTFRKVSLVYLRIMAGLVLAAAVAELLGATVVCIVMVSLVVGYGVLIVLFYGIVYRELVRANKKFGFVK